MKAKVNENAYGSWLEPYIGWEFQVKKVTKRLVHFWMDVGLPQPELFNHNKDLFDLSKPNNNMEQKFMWRLEDGKSPRRYLVIKETKETVVFIINSNEIREHKSGTFQKWFKTREEAFGHAEKNLIRKKEHHERNLEETKERLKDLMRLKSLPDNEV